MRPPFRSRETVVSGYAPMREPSVSRCARPTVEIESSWTHPSRRIVAATSSARARRNRVGIPLVRDDVAAQLDDRDGLHAAAYTSSAM